MNNTRNESSDNMNTSQDQQHSPLIMYIALLIGLIVSLTVSLAFLITWAIRKKKRHLQWRNSQLAIRHRKNCYILNKKVICDEVSQTEGYEARMGCILRSLLTDEQQKKLRPWLVARKEVESMELVGEGAFATVHKGRFLRDIPPTMVALKTLKDTCCKVDVVAFIEEALVLSECRHRNVVGLMAVTVDLNLQLPVIVFPYMQNGDLQSYLRRKQEQQEQFQQEDVLLMKRHLLFSLHIANGMKYITEMGYIHRDLATRNCMLDEYFVVKIGDFGLAQTVSANSSMKTSRQRCMPIRWMAPESMRCGEFSEKSDVWSYGVTIWEILTLAKTPYFDLANIEILPFLTSGNRLSRPTVCPDNIYTVIQRCFEENPNDRPGFSEIVQYLEDYITLTSGYLNLQSSSSCPDTCPI